MHGDDVVSLMVERAQALVAERGGALECFGAREGQVVEI